MLTGRFVKFAKSLVSSKKTDVSYLAKVVKNDQRTLMGRTLGQIARDSDIPKDALNSAVVKNKLIYFPVPEDEKWRVEILLELLDVRNAAGTV